MMSRRSLALGSFVGAVAFSLALSLGVARAQDAVATTATATTTTAPTSAPEPMVANPHYLAWAKYKPGTQVELEMNLLAGGQQMTTTVTMTLNEITPERAIVRSVARMSVPGLPSGQEHQQTHTFNIIVPQSEADRAMRPAGGEGELKQAGTEIVEAAGRTFQTKVHEFNGMVQGVPAQAKQWRSNEVPGGLVKIESSTGNTKLQMFLTRVTAK